MTITIKITSLLAIIGGLIWSSVAMAAHPPSVGLHPDSELGDNGWYTTLLFREDIFCHGGSDISIDGPDELPQGEHHIVFWTDGNGLLVQIDGGKKEGVFGACIRDGADELTEVLSMDYKYEKGVSVAITSPSHLANVNGNSTLVSGTFGVAPGSDATITVNGVTATKGSGGTWSATVPLNDGFNEITANLTSVAGNTTSSSITVLKQQSSSGSDSGGSSSGGGDSGGGGGGGGGGEEPQPESQPAKKTGQVKGATTVAISAADRKAPDFIQNATVPAVVERIFSEVFGRKITPAESTYWKSRARSDKATESKLKGTMLWHKARGSTGVKQPQGAGAKSTASNGSLVPRINALFRSVYSRNPSISENQYWLSRISDKPTEGAIVGAMTYHKIHNITH